MSVTSAVFKGLAMSVAPEVDAMALRGARSAQQDAVSTQQLEVLMPKEGSAFLQTENPERTFKIEVDSEKVDSVPFDEVKFKTTDHVRCTVTILKGGKSVGEWIVDPTSGKVTGATDGLSFLIKKDLCELVTTIYVPNGGPGKGGNFAGRFTWQPQNVLQFRGVGGWTVLHLQVV